MNNMLISLSIFQKNCWELAQMDKSVHKKQGNPLISLPYDKHESLPLGNLTS